MFTLKTIFSYKKRREMKTLLQKRKKKILYKKTVKVKYILKREREREREQKKKNFKL